MKKWLSKREALEFMDCGEKFLEEIVLKFGVGKSKLNSKVYYNREHLDAIRDELAVSTKKAA